MTNNNKNNKIFITIKIIIIIVLLTMSLINGDVGTIDVLLKTLIGCL